MLQSIISKIISILISSAILFGGGHCLAQEQGYIEFATIGGNVTSGYINSTNEGFVISGFIPNVSNFGYGQIKINDVVLVDKIALDNDSFSFNASMDQDELKLLLPEGENTVSLCVYDQQDLGISKYETIVMADYEIVPAELNLNYSASSKTNPGYLKVKDKIDFELVTEEKISIINNKFNDRNLSWTQTDESIGTYIYSSEYTVTEGDPDTSLPYEAVVSYMDSAGNSGKVSADLQLKIDSNLPSLKITSIEQGKYYRNNDIRFQFTSDEELAGYTVDLNGKFLDIKNNELIENLSDGKYNLTVTANDLAGNATETTVVFYIDTKAPQITLNSQLNSSYTRGDEIVFEGVTQPESEVIVEIHSDIKSYKTIADLNGVWRITIDSSNLTEETHSVFVEIIDLAGNLSKVLVGKFDLMAPVILSEESPKLAEALPENETVASDIKPIKYNRTVSQAPEEIAFDPQIISSSDERPVGINWSLWLIIVGLIAVSFLVAGVSYYGYSQAVAIVNRQKENTSGFSNIISRDKDKLDRHDTQVNKSESEESAESDEDTQVRW